MKKIHLLLMIMLTVAVCSCGDKLLDIPQQGVQSEDNSYTTDEDCEAAITAVYAGWRSIWSGKGLEVTYCTLFWLKNLLADEMFSEHTNQVEFSRSTVTATNEWIKGTYKSLYETIYLANLVLDKFDPKESDTKARSVAEAKFFRALCYYELITLWGRVPKVDHVLKPEEYQVPQAEIADLWAFVEKDLTEAIESKTLASKKNKDDKETGIRITREAAYAVLGKVYLTEEKFSDARNAFNEVISSNLYGLIDDMTQLYHIQTNGCKEYIFENNRHWDNNNITEQDGWYGMEDNWPFGYYIVWDGVTGPFKFLTVKGWGAMCPAKKVYDALIAEEGPSSMRRKASVISINEIGDYGVTYTEASVWRGCEGVLRMKWLVSADDESQTQWTGRLNNIPCMRYADVLLMMAEACVRDGKNGDDYYNEVRTRAGLPNKTGVTFDDVKKERFLELCFEGTRFQDLKRWGDLAKECADKGKTIPSLNPGPTVLYADNPDPAAGFQERDNLLPFPEVEIQTNKNIKQNYDY
ncbi:MAG: RagB/SusD family nutrient uptake outer membrane protein [Bacteroidales bacterium]|nr:RagB/SusD family nutrient uptake outer membrane protein [Bacteroidales bacterium]